MPFTFAHPAIVFPLRKARWKLSFTGLVIGSIVPDFEFYLKMQLGENIGHHAMGFFLFDIPMALLMYLVFEFVMRPVLLGEGKPSGQGRKTGFPVLLLSVSIGAFSHIAWDGLTHDYGLMVQSFAFLRSNWVLGGISKPVYEWLQVFFSIWGLWFVLKQERNWQLSFPSRFFLPLVLLFGLLVLLIRLWMVPAFNGFWDGFFACAGSVCYGLVLACICYYRRVQNLGLIKQQE